VLDEFVSQQPGFRCVATFSNEAEAWRELPRLRVNLVLANRVAPNLTNAAWAEALRQLKPELVGVLYSVFEDSDELFKATPGGASGYLLKRTAPADLLAPLGGIEGPVTREVVALRVREYFQKLVSAMPAGAAALELASLTPREHEILALLAKGRLAKEIAVLLGISIWTVQGHVKSIFDKLSVHTRTEAVVKFLQK
jgi:DNA-binding NarL/FixJ family response regulator